ncbi:DUF1405 domain-containing protein [Staphylococcus sp. SQ8-PEA]|uniref:DUF1405 domain-containing protein n=1 Tax=Staphylococcus marylandisciuri TaxID=2981529 RepID=A0ABT2QND1_9STAP|nr:DUF1405 domain-containing protein [Staphylococcus marylandisciuri]MCU5745489.1 DUF1405 domain-containing protein [Staphylococcus marylandisciuri]
MQLRSIWFYFIYSKKCLWLFFICNLIGTIYGYVWYSNQIHQTKGLFKFFVPDSPTATLFLTIVLFLFIIGRNWPVLEGLAFVSLVKYGLWAVLINVILMFYYNLFTVTSVFLLISHSIMALEAIIFAPRFKFNWIACIVALIWIFHNDVIDYVFMQYPIYPFIASHLSLVAYLTFWLSVLSLVCYILLTRSMRNRE